VDLADTGVDLVDVVADSVDVVADSVDAAAHIGITIEKVTIKNNIFRICILQA